MLLEGFKAMGMEVTYLTQEQNAAFAETIAQWKNSMIDQFGEYACGCFGITK